MAELTPRVVIIGGGFAGLNAARALNRAPVQVTLLDRRNHHLFQPLLYQVATAALSPSDIAMPIRRILRYQKNVEVLLAEAVAIDLWPAWEAVQCPTLILRGEESDILTRETAETMRSRRPGVTLIELPGIGHAPSLMEPDQMTPVEDWLRSNVIFT